MTLPAISCGVYGYPLDEGARIAVQTTAAHLRDTARSVERTTFVLFSADAHEAFDAALRGVATPR